MAIRSGTPLITGFFTDSESLGVEPAGAREIGLIVAQIGQVGERVRCGQVITGCGRQVAGLHKDGLRAVGSSCGSVGRTDVSKRARDPARVVPCLRQPDALAPQRHSRVQALAPESRVPGAPQAVAPHLPAPFLRRPGVEPPHLPHEERVLPGRGVGCGHSTGDPQEVLRARVGRSGGGIAKQLVQRFTRLVRQVCDHRSETRCVVGRRQVADPCDLLRCLEGKEAHRREGTESGDHRGSSGPSDSSDSRSSGATSSNSTSSEPSHRSQPTRASKRQK